MASRTRLFRTASFRLVAIYGLSFTVASALLGAGVYRSVDAEVAREFDDRIGEESDALQGLYATQGGERLAQVLAARAAGGVFAYGLQARDGRLIAGVARPPSGKDGKPSLGWVEMPEAEADEAPEGAPEMLRALVTRLADGTYLVVGDEQRRTMGAMRAILVAFGWAIAGILALALAGGIWTSAQFLRRIDAMHGAARALMAGDWSRRIPVDATSDDLSQLARAFNRLFERIEKLLLANKHVSADIAHDLRKPLAHTLRRLEALRAPGDLKPEIETELEGAAADIEGVLATFDALLRIGQLQAGARRAAFRSIDLRDIAQEAAAAFRPSAEDDGRVIVEQLTTPFPLQGDRDLLMQMIANLIDNALRHTPPGASICVRTEADARGPRLVVCDNGFGVAETELNLIFDRFYRSEAAAFASGNGLGLALVAAIAEMHDLAYAASDNRPGLKITIVPNVGERDGAA